MAKQRIPTITRGFDSPGLALHNLSRGDLGGIVHSFLNPDQLTLEQRGLGSTGLIREEDGPFTRILKTVGPLVAIGMALSARYPVPTAKGLIRFTGAAKSYTQRLTPGLHALQSPHWTFRGTNFGRLIERVADETHNFKESITRVWGEGVVKFQQRTGRMPSFTDQVAASVHLDGLNNPDSPMWKAIRAGNRRSLYAAKYAHLPRQTQIEYIKGRVDAAIEQKVQRMGWMVNSAGLSNPVDLIEYGRKGTDAVHLEMLKAGNLKRLAEAVGMKNPKTGEALRGFRHMNAEQLAKQAEALGMELPFMTPAQVKASGAFGSGPKAYGRYLESFRAKLVEGTVFKYRKTYFPHMAELSDAQMTEHMKKMWDMTPSARKAIQQGAGAVSPTSRQIEKRLYGMIPSADDLESFLPGVFTPETIEGLRNLAGTRQSYSLRVVSVMQNYTHSMGKMYGWTARGWGRHIKDEIEVMREVAKNNLAARLRLNMAENTYLPIAMGKLGPGETIAALGWGEAKKATFDFFTNPKTWKVLGGGNEAVGQKNSEWLVKKLVEPAIMDLTFKNAGAKMAGYLYYSTLGLNPVSAGLNLLQNLMTTPAVVEWKHIAKGFGAATSQMKKFIDVYSKGGLTIDQAILKAMPEFAKMGGVAESDLAGIVLRARGGKQLLNRTEQAKQVLMGLFTTSERFNRLWAYHAGVSKAVAEGIPDAAHRVGMEVMKLSQFPGGALATPALMAKLPAPLRQFTHFPLRTLELFTRNPGTAGRMLAAGGAVYGAGQMAGMDLSRALVFGAMPSPMGEDQPFYPLPLAPPIVGLAGGVMSDLFKGEFEQTRRNLPLLVPGGTALSRASTFIAPALAEKLGRPYADYANTLPDGRVPVYTGSGELRGFESGLGMVARAAGWRSLAGDPEGDLARYLLAQRDKIRATHREYVEALGRNDFTRAKTINDEYKKQFGLGDLVVKETDLRAVHLRHDVARIERLLETMSPEARVQYGQHVAMVLGDSAESFFGVDPALLANPETPTIKSRQPYRARPEGRQYQQLQQVREQGGSETLRTDHVGRTPNDPFNAFEGFSPFGRGQ